MVQSLNPKTQGARQVYGGVHLTQVTGFGDLSVAELTPIIQLQYPYNINTRLLHRHLNGSGAASVADSLLSISSGTTTGSTAMVMSRQAAKYHPGQGTMVRFTALFTPGVADTKQEIGYGLVTDGFFFGFDGADFGILRRTGGMREVQTLTITAGAGTSGGDIRITLDGQTKDVTVALNDTIGDVVRKIVAETDWSTVGNGWSVEPNGDEVIFRTFDAAPKTGTFSLADVSTTTGVAGTFVETIVGKASTDIWTKQTDWNGDKLDGTGPSGMVLDHTKGNVYAIQFQWLGFGGIRFCVEDPNINGFIVVHELQYANTNTAPSVQNPSLPLHNRVNNGTTTSDIVIKTSSGAVFTEGKDERLGITFGTTSSKALADTTETVIMAIKPKTVYQGVENRVNMLPLFMTISVKAAAATKSHTVRLYVNPIIGGIPNFVDVDTNNSVTAVDTSGTTVSGGTLIGSISLGQIDSGAFILEDIIPLILPGDLVVITGQIDQDTSTIDVSGIWRELF